MKNKKALIVLERIKKLGLDKPITKKEIAFVEQSLNVVLPNDFKFFCSHCSYEFFYFFDTLRFTDSEDCGVISETKGWRESIDLPHNYLVLTDDGTSSVLMKLENNHKSSVIWCSLEDVLNLITNKKMQYNPTIFNSFTDFYEFLLNEEEKERSIVDRQNNHI